MLFSKFVTECFEPGVLPTLKFATQEIYSSLLRTHLTPRFGDQRLCDISRIEVQHFVLKKLKQGFALETANHLRNLMSKVLGTAVSWEYLADNIVRGVKMPERFLKRPHQFLELDEVRRLIAACTEPTRTIVFLATMTGLRIGEILALRWKRIDFIRESLVVAETCYLGRFGTPKTRASKRELPLSPAVVDALKVHFSRSTDRGADDLVFTSRSGGPLVSNNLRNRGLRSACKRSGLPRLSWHALRHTHGTLLHSQGTPLKVAQAQLGHSDLATTLEVYTHASLMAQREAVHLLEKQLFPSVPKNADGSRNTAEAATPTN